MIMNTILLNITIPYKLHTFYIIVRAISDFTIIQ